MMEEIDFTSCRRIGGKAYNGANGKKIAVEYSGETWILKFPPNVTDKPNNQSYSNSCISEHLGSSIYRLLGISAQETKLGTFVNGKSKVVCACKDFTRPGLKLYDFCSIKNTVLDTGSGGAGTELNDILETIVSQSFMDSISVLNYFWEMFIVDAFLGNFDRHNGNWGFLMDEISGKCTLAPVYDNGSCLLPQADDSIMRKVLDDPDEMNARIFTFPASMIKIDGKKINYYDFLHSKDMPEGLVNVLKKLLPKIKSLDLATLISGTPYLTPLQRDFYLAYLNERRRILF